MVLRVANGGFIKGTGGGILRGRAVSSVLHSFTLTNTEGATTSTGFGRVGLAFSKGDIPSGQIPDASIGGSVIRSAMIGKNTWSDGSLRSCTLAYDAGTFTAGQAKTVEVMAVTGTQGTSGLNVSTALNAIDDLTVEIRNHTGSDNNTNVGDLDFSLQTAIATATRTETTDDTPLVVRLWSWQKVSPDEHLRCINFVDIWLDSGGAVEAVEWTPVLSQDWFVDDPDGVAQTKQLRNYDATAKSGITTLVSHTGLAHAYYCRAAVLRDDDDDQHAKRLWIDEGTAMPTLNMAYSTASKQKMARIGYLPPLMTSAISVARTYTQNTHVPLGDNSGSLSHNHREDISGTGAYNGRGMVSDMDAQALISQTASLWRTARVSAQAGLSVFFHVRDHRLAVGGTANGDISAGLIPAPFLELGAQSYSGLAGELVATFPSDGSTPDDAPVGGNGPFGSWDLAHHVNYSGMMAFVEGEAYLADAALSAYDYPIRALPNSVSGTDVTTLFGTNHPTRATAQGILSTPTFGALHMPPVQERGPGWGQNTALRALQIMPDADRHASYLENAMENASDYIVESLSKFPTSHTAKGSWIHTTGAAGSPWMNAFGVLAAWDTVPIADDKGWTGFRGWAEQGDKMIANTYENDPYASCAYRLYYTIDAEVKLVYTPADETYFMREGSVTSDVFTIDQLLAGVDVRDDDFVYISQDDDAGVNQTAPSGLAFETKYHVVNATPASNTFQLSLTQGGAAITGITDQASVWFAVKAADATDVTPVGDGGAFMPGDDDFGSIVYAALELAALRGSPNMTPAIVSAARTFHAPKVALWGTETNNAQKYFAWNYDGDFS